MKKNNLKILFLIGIPASGKSTWATDFVKYNDEYIRVSRDDFRKMLKNAQVCENKIEDMITSLVDSTIGHALSKRLNVILDNTNLKMKYITPIIEKFRYQADIDYRVFDISLDKAIERDSNRDAKVGAEVIKKMFKDYKVLIDTLDFQPIKMGKRIPIKLKKSENREGVIFDIDGTLAHMGDRSPFDWDKVYKDDLNKFVFEHINFHKGLGRVIIFVTGRDASCRKETQEWFEMYGLDASEYSMYMRPKDDFRKDTVVKREIYTNDIKDNFNIVCVYDDRLQVLEMWNQEGIFTFNVNQGQINF